MIWESLSSSNELPDTTSSFIIFKHSPRCSISNLAKSRFERNWPVNQKTPVYLINVLNQRELSNQIQDFYGISHQSPQVLVIKNGVCILNDSHNGIDAIKVIDSLT